MIKINRSKIIDDELVEYVDTFYDYKDVALYDTTRCLKSMGRDINYINETMEDIDDIIQVCMNMHDTCVYFEDIVKNSEYIEFSEILSEYLLDNY